jgi:hypothetical protein
MHCQRCDLVVEEFDHDLGWNACLAEVRKRFAAPAVSQSTIRIMAKELSDLEKK